MVYKKLETYDLHPLISYVSIRTDELIPSEINTLIALLVKTGLEVRTRREGAHRERIKIEISGAAVVFNNAGNLFRGVQETTNE